MKKIRIKILIGNNEGDDGMLDIVETNAELIDIQKFLRRQDLLWAVHKMLGDYGFDHNLWSVTDIKTGAAVCIGFVTKDLAIAKAIETASGLFPDIYEASRRRLEAQAREKGIQFPLNELK